MEKTVRIIDALTGFLGKTVAWLSLVMILTTLVIVVMRYFSHGSIAAQESVQYMHATIFMIGIAYTLRLDEHVRVDIFYNRFSPRRKAVVNIIGTMLFLLPFAAAVVWFSWSDVSRSWHVMERSVQADGLPYVYLLKSLIPIFAALLFLQGGAEILRNILILRGKVVTDEGVSHE